jgi:uncharacterized membrane protein HdeD (DUF308 family)
MQNSIVAVLVGIVCIVIGIFNMQGRIGTLKRKHRKRVKEEDVLPYGRRIGIATIIMGGALVLYGVFSALQYFTKNETYTIIGTAILIAGLVVGGVLAVFAMIKYNKGVF